MVEDCSIDIKLDHYIDLVDKNIFGHFIEHLGRCIYPGVWVGINSKVSDGNGFRRDTVDALKSIFAPVIRWPGGCFADYYHWSDGVGPRESRPRRLNVWWKGEESNEFGTDEFIQFCKVVGAEPYICVNVGSGSPEEALAWLEYCNLSGNTKYANMRASNGHIEPYNVKFWGVGNESWGCGGNFDPVYYAWEYRRFSTFLKRADPSIKLIACGHITRDWNFRFMEAMRDHIHLIDYLSIHYYFRNGQRYGDDVNFSDEQYFNLLYDIQHLEYLIQQAIYAIDFFSEGRKDIGLIVDEWGVWHPQATVETGLYQQNTLRDAILAASVLNLFTRYSNKIKMANIAQAQSVCLTEGNKTILTPTYHVFNMYKSHMNNYALKVECESPTVWSGEKESIVQRKLKPLKALDASASISQDKKILVLTVVNQSLDKDYSAKISNNRGVKFLEATLVTLNANNVRSYNDFESKDNVKTVEETFTVNSSSIEFTFKKHSVNRLTIKLE
ncbi:MAG: alpha-N-arabinofuranosidase [Nitrososphaeria archaeon]|nr:alpha-N-arabinofuranosidase [Nitrososphaeria archaeon]